MKTESLIEHFGNYCAQLKRGMESVSQEELNKAFQALVMAAFAKKFIFVGGNGGSASISNHLCCDFIKGTLHKDYDKFKVISLSSNTPLLTAISNDISYDDSLSFQLDVFLNKECNPQDVVLLISSSGNSPNIIKAAQLAKKRGATVIGFTGFDGGKLKEIADIKLHVPIKNYGVVEDCHQAIMHIISQYIRKQRGD